MKVFLVFTLDSEEEWGDRVAGCATTLRQPPEGTSFVVIDNDCPAELAPSIHSIAGTVGAKVQRIQRTPKWRIVGDVLTGQALAGCTEPVLVCSADDPRIVRPIEIRGLLGPARELSEDFVYTTNPVELMESVAAKTREWPNNSPFAPATTVSRTGVRHAAPLENLATMFGVESATSPTADEDAMPEPVHETLVAFYRSRLNDEAAAFLVKLQSASQIADDFVDGQIKPHWASDAMRRMLEFLLLEIPNDAFYKAHRFELEEVIAQCITTWHLSNELTVDYTPESRLWCFVQREAFQVVIWRAAVLVGGLERGRAVLREIQQMLHGPNGVGKRFPDWLAEVRVKSDGR